MGKFKACVLLAATPVCAQQVSVSATATTPLHAAVGINEQMTIETFPAGPMPAEGTLYSRLPSQPWQARSAFCWTIEDRAPAQEVHICTLHRAVLQPTTTPLTSTLGYNEVLFELTAPEPRAVTIDLQVLGPLYAISGTPLLEADVHDDGVVDVSFTAPNSSVSLNVGPQPTPIVMRSLISITAMPLIPQPWEYNFQLSMRIHADNDTDIAIAHLACQTPYHGTFFCEEAFEHSGIVFRSPQPQWSPHALILGLSQQPMTLPPPALIPVPACVVHPSRDLVFVTAANASHLPLPAAVRPINLFAQAVFMLPGQAVTSHCFQISAH